MPICADLTPICANLTPVCADLTPVCANPSLICADLTLDRRLSTHDKMAVRHGVALDVVNLVNNALDKMSVRCVEWQCHKKCPSA
jgi:hypothetical protein